MKRFLVGSFILVFTQLLFSADVDVYGSMRIDGWWLNSERFFPGTTDTSVNGDTLFGEDSLPIIGGSIFPDGLLGIKFVHDNFTGIVEMGVQERVYKAYLALGTQDRELFTSKKSMPFLRKWYVKMAINDIVDFLVGQDYLPTNFLTSNQQFFGGNGFINSGCLYTGRRPSLQLFVHDPENRFEGRFALAKSDTFSIRANGANENYTYLCETKLPRISGSFGIELSKNWFGFNFGVAGEYQKYGFIGMHQTIPKDSARQTIQSYVMGVTNTLKFGWFSHVVNGVYGQNLSAHGVAIGDPFSFWSIGVYTKIFEPVYDATIPEKDKITNGTAWMINEIIQIKPWGFLYCEGGYGVVAGKHEYRPYTALQIPQYSWYFQTVGKIQENLGITVEIGQYIIGPYFGGGRYFYWGTALEFEF